MYAEAYDDQDPAMNIETVDTDERDDDNTAETTATTSSLNITNNGTNTNDEGAASPEMQRRTTQYLHNILFAGHLMDYRENFMKLSPEEQALENCREQDF
ncbi:MAG: hypothetical protein ACI90V_010928 [Bacillariaceae sp.]|jgi:hypothetical protein